jgi:hypothetical protein
VGPANVRLGPVRRFTANRVIEIRVHVKIPVTPPSRIAGKPDMSGYPTYQDLTVCSGDNFRLADHSSATAFVTC